MKISSYSIQQKSAHKLEKTKDVSERLEAWTGSRQNAGVSLEGPSFRIDLGSNQQVFEYTAEKTYFKSQESEDAKDQTTEVKLKLIESFIYMTTGKRVKLKPPEFNAYKTGGADLSDPTAAFVNAQERRDNWGLVYEFHEVTAEQESVFFNSAGTVNLSNGATISFELDFNMSRAFYQENHVNLRMGNAAKVDPLVIALDGHAPQLTKSRHAFDLNGDGTNENIAYATGGSGFLALDKNEDGMINNGLELFGPESGDGFSELRAFDMDNNGWIDENDDVFSKLLIYSVSENGDKTLFRLGDAGVGAIYLNDISTLYNFKDSTGVSAGEMASTSIFLKEDGTAGTIHHIDLTI